MTASTSTCFLTRAALAIALLISLGAALPLPAANRLERDFRQPPPSAQPWAYGWWLDGAASREGITADFEAMKRQGISTVLLFDAGVGGTNAPKGQLFLSDGWRELFRHTLREADRLKIDVGVNLCSGWNACGTWVTPELAAKKLVWSQATVEGPREQAVSLSLPPATTNYYRDITVLALPLRDAGGVQITNLELKAGREYAVAPSCTKLADALAADHVKDQVMQFADRSGHGMIAMPVAPLDENRRFAGRPSEDRLLQVA